MSSMFRKRFFAGFWRMAIGVFTLRHYAIVKLRQGHYSGEAVRIYKEIPQFLVRMPVLLATGKFAIRHRSNR